MPNNNRRDSDRITYLPNRRQVLIKGIAGAVAVAGFWSRTGTVFASVPGVTKGETPGLEEGPFWVDGQPERVDVRPDSVTGIYPAGTPLYLGFTLSQLSDTAPYTIVPLVGAKVDIWNCNAQGVYSDEASESTTGTNYQRGYQISSAHGSVEFLTNYSGWYSGRTPHVHIRVRIYNLAGTQTYNWCTQLFFNDTITAAVFAANSAYNRTTTRDTYNTDDRVLTGAAENGSPETEAGDYTIMTLANDASHVQATFHIILDLSDTANEDPTNGTETGGGGGGGGAPASTIRSATTQSSGTTQANTTVKAANANSTTTNANASVEAVNTSSGTAKTAARRKRKK